MSDEQKQDRFDTQEDTGPYKVTHTLVDGPEHFAAFADTHRDANIIAFHTNSQAARIAELETALSKSLPNRDHSCNDGCLFLPCVQRRRIEKLEMLIHMKDNPPPMWIGSPDNPEDNLYEAQNWEADIRALHAELFPEGGAK